jgi:hypothetical protein
VTNFYENQYNTAFSSKMNVSPRKPLTAADEYWGITESIPV